MRIAILGWGSLLWEGGPEFDRWHAPWEYDGPVLKLEFSRVSEKRLKAMTLVIDAEHGVEIAVAWCVSKRTALADATRDLRVREGTISDKSVKLPLVWKGDWREVVLDTEFVRGRAQRILKR